MTTPAAGTPILTDPDLRMVPQPSETAPNSKIFAAVCAVMHELHDLRKDEKNDHGGYKYVSVDAFKAMMRPVMAKHGLSLMITEEAFELVPLTNAQGKQTMNAQITYALQLRHISGEREDPERATVILPLTGAQTAGAARSYVIKEYLKGRFLVATGDKDLIVGGADADAYAQQDYTASDEPPAKSAYRARKDGTDKEFTRIMAGLNAIEATGTIEDLAIFWKANYPKIKEMPVGWNKELTEKKDELKAAFEEGENRPLLYDPRTGEVLGVDEVVPPDMSGDR